MPEGLEAEIYRRAANQTVGRTIRDVEVDDRQEMAADLVVALPGATVERVRRHGKLVMLDLGNSQAACLGLHFGMTGRLVVDEVAPIAELEYASNRDDPSWDRFVITFDRGGRLRVNDPRRWARFVLDPDLGRLGPDFLTVTAEHLLRAFGRRGTPVKSALLDQSVVAGYGNLCVDELLWQVGIDPHRPAREVPDATVTDLVAFARPHLRKMLRRGGSHRGTSAPEIRAALPSCPRDGVPLKRSEVGGRTTVWCPGHQH